MAFSVVYDTSALFGNTVRDVLVRVTMSRLVRARWTNDILDELDRKLAERYRISEEKLLERRTRMNRANPDGLVTGYEHLIDGLTLRDPDDRHVLAAAIKCNAQAIVTADRDFTVEDLAPWHIDPKTPDDFLLDLYDLAPGQVYGCVQQIADGRSKPPQTVDDVLEELAAGGLIEFAAALSSGAPLR